MIEEIGEGVKDFKVGDLSLFPLRMVADTVNFILQDLKQIIQMR